MFRILKVHNWNDSHIVKKNKRTKIMRSCLYTKYCKIQCLYRFLLLFYFAIFRGKFTILKWKNCFCIFRMHPNYWKADFSQLFSVKIVQIFRCISFEMRFSGKSVFEFFVCIVFCICAEFWTWTDILKKGSNDVKALKCIQQKLNWMCECSANKIPHYTQQQ